MNCVTHHHACDCREAAHAAAIVELRQRAEAAAAKLDAVMLEYCPDEMTEEQRKRWAANQVPAQSDQRDEP